MSPLPSSDRARPVRFRVVIPARYQSTRLPGKPLLPIGGRPMIHYVHQNAIQAGAESVVVATDDERIATTVRRFGGDAVMTSSNHASGTDRIAEVLERKQWNDDAIVVNLQGDEPAIGPELLRSVAHALHSVSDAGMATVATPIRTMSSLVDSNVVKVVTSRRGMALCFSRAPIPFVRDQFCHGIRKDMALPSHPTFLRHLGLYAYRAWAIKQLANEPPCDYEQAESLEQLRALAIGIQIYVSVIDEAPAHGVDTEDDLLRVNQQFGQYVIGQ